MQILRWNIGVLISLLSYDIEIGEIASVAELLNKEALLCESTSKVLVLSLRGRI